LTVKENGIEQRLVKVVRAMGCIAPKLVFPGAAGMPDHPVLLPGGRIIFVEALAASP
jgi:hypothetical protein